MNNNGWVSIHRKIMDSQLWTAEPFTKGQAWIDLILLATHKDTYFFKRGIKINLKRGQVGLSEVGLSDRWKWTRKKVRNFLFFLKSEQQIEQQKSNVTQIITILNYGKYQGKDTAGDTAGDTSECTHSISINKGNKETSNNPYGEIVALFHSLCPDLPKVTRITEPRKKAINARMKEYDLNTIKECFRMAGESDFLNGRKTEFNASFDWIMKPTNFLKIIEKNYENGKRDKTGIAARGLASSDQHAKDRR